MAEKNVFQVLLGEFYDKLDRLKDLVEREAKFPEAPSKIKVAIGMRRTGKTYFVFQHILKLLQEGVDRNCILYINFEDDRLLPLDQHVLAKLIESFYSLYPENHDRKCYIFLDEIQNVDQWPTVVRRFHDSKNVEIFLTGSSAKLLSKEIATSLRGRSLSVEIWPYQFHEFLRALKVSPHQKLYDKKTEDKRTALFQNYLSVGGFPEVISFAPDVRQQTLQEYLDVAIYRDLIERHHVKHPALIKYMILCMVHNVGKPFAIHKFYNDVKSQGYHVGKDILYEYAQHIEDAYLIFPLSLYDKSIRKVQTNPKKLYAIDPGLVRALTFDYDNDLGRLFENIIYLDLRRMGCTVHYYLTADRNEIDFLVQTPQGRKKLIQIVWKIEDAKTLQREERALEAGIKELKIEGQILTLDSYLREGIKV